MESIKLSNEEISRAELMDLLRSEYHANEESRSRLERLLTDDVATTLLACQIQLDRINKYLGEKEAKLRLEETKGWIDEVVQTLRPEIEKLGPSPVLIRRMETGIKSVCYDARRNNPIKLDLVADPMDDLDNMSPEKKYCLYHLFSELLETMIKHSGYTNFTINIAIKPDVLNIKFSGEGEKKAATLHQNSWDKVKTRLLILEGFVDNATDWSNSVTLGIPLNKNN